MGYVFNLIPVGRIPKANTSARRGGRQNLYLLGQSTAFSAMGYYVSNPETAIGTRAGAEYGSVAEVTSEFFRVFAVEPAVGRFFSPEEVRPGSPGVVAISYSYWQSHFGADPKSAA